MCSYLCSDRCSCECWCIPHICPRGLFKVHAPDIALLQWKVPGDLPLDIEIDIEPKRKMSDRENSPLEPTASSSAESTSLPKLFIECLPPEIIREIVSHLDVRHKILFGLSGSNIYRHLPLEVYRSIRAYPKRSREAYVKLFRRLGPVFHACVPRKSRDNHYYRIACGLENVMRKKHDEHTFMDDCISVHSDIENNLEVQDIATAFVSFLLGATVDVKPCQTWCEECAPAGSSPFASRTGSLRHDGVPWLLNIQKSLMSGHSTEYKKPIYKYVRYFASAFQTHVMDFKDPEASLRRLDNALRQFTALHMSQGRLKSTTRSFASSGIVADQAHSANGCEAATGDISLVSSGSAMSSGNALLQ